MSDDKPFKVGFSFAKPTTTAATKKKDKGEDDERDYVTDIRGNHLKSLIPSKKTGPLVIPLELQRGNKRTKVAPKAEDMTIQTTTASDTVNAHFKVEDLTQQITVAALTDEKKSLDELAAEAIIRDVKNEILSVDTDKIILPIILQNQIEGIENITNEDERFKYDVESRPDEAGEEEYENVPIEEFGTAMLRGMGWEVGKPIGLNNRGLTEPIEYVARQGRLGLGATPETVAVKKKKFIKPGESREPKPIMVAPTGPDGKVRHIKRISEKLVPLKKGLAGRLAAIASGPHEGLYARVVQELPNDEVAVNLIASDETVVVAKSDLNLTITESSISEDHPTYKIISKEKAKRHKEEEDNNYNNNNKHTHKSSSKHSSDSKSSSKSGNGTNGSSTPTWLFPHIMVRILNKKREGGKYYNKKGHVVDVVGRHECIVQLPGGTLVEGLKQKKLETVIPKEGGKVLVVRGSNKGSKGTLLERKKNGKNVECGVVQLASDLSISVYELDDIAEYVGAPDNEDYMDM